MSVEAKHPNEPNQTPRRARRYPRLGWMAAMSGLGLLASSGLSAAPAIDAWMTPAGTRVLFVAAPDLPMVDVRVVFDAGSARDGARPGLAALTAAMLTEGAGGFSADAVAERIESVGASLDAGADRDTSWVSLRSLTESKALATAEDMLTWVLTAPTFDPAELERVRENTLTALRMADQDPASVGQRALYKAVFGDHPYAADPTGTAETVAAITRTDLIEFHRQLYSAANATVAIVGALDRNAAAELAMRITASLPSGARPAPLPAVADLAEGVVSRISFPSSQTHLLLGEPGMRRGDPDYFPLYVGNHILGGSGLVSQLMNEVREKRGLAYSVYSMFVPMMERGPLLLGLQTKNDQAELALGVLRETLTRFVTSGPSDKELTAALKNITGGFPLRTASNANIVQYLAMIGFYGLPLDYLDRFTDRVSAVTGAQIRDAFQRRVHPQRLAVIMVGAPAAAVEGAPKEPAGPGPAPVVDDGNG